MKILNMKPKKVPDPFNFPVKKQIKRFIVNGFLIGLSYFVLCLVVLIFIKPIIDFSKWVSLPLVFVSDLIVEMLGISKDDFSVILPLGLTICIFWGFIFELIRKLLAVMLQVKQAVGGPESSEL